MYVRFEKFKNWLKANAKHCTFAGRPIFTKILLAKTSCFTVNEPSQNKPPSPINPPGWRRWYCDVPGSPCLSKTGPVYGPFFNGPKDPWSHVLSLPGAKVVRWRPHLPGTWQYIDFHPSFYGQKRITWGMQELCTNRGVLSVSDNIFQIVDGNYFLRAPLIHGLNNVVCYRKDNPAGTLFLPSDCGLRFGTPCVLAIGC